MSFPAARSRESELMDTEPVGLDEFAACLRDLEWLNRWSLGYRPTLGWLARIAPVNAPLSLLDVGCGYGDMLRRIRRWARRTGRDMTLTGVDINPWAREAAEAATPTDASIRYLTSDVFALPEQRYDIVISALFAHHLDDEALVRFLRWMQAHARRGWFINDLHRHPVPYWFLRGLFAALPFNRLTVHDGPVSVSRAFVRRDWERLVAESGLERERIEIRWRAPFRWGVGTRPTFGTRPASGSRP